MRDAKAVLEGLTEAQKRLLRNHPFWGASSYATIKALRARGLLDMAEITPLGLQVRALIEEQKV